jgi:hypothetical protein
MGVSMSLINVSASPAQGERTLWDSVNLRGITGARPGDMIAYYLNGRYAVRSIAYVEDLFPPELYRLVPIDTDGTRPEYARVLDVELGDARPAQTEEWLQAFAGSNPAYEGGGRGEIYCDRATIPAVRVGTGRFALADDYYLWVATGDGTLATGPGVNACQNVWARTYDRSAVYDPRWLSGVGAAS